MEDLIQERVAIVVVHGVAPHPRYEFQDECSADLVRHLNEIDGDDAWVIDVVNPGNVLEPGDDNPLPTISRVHKADDDGTNPRQTYYDVMEAYWSAIDKGRTKWWGVVGWMLRVVFVPLNTTARYHATWQKQFFDYGFIGGALVVSFALFFISLTAVWQSFLRILDVTGLIRKTYAGDVITTLNANANAPGGIPVKIGVWLFVGLIGAFLFTQGLVAVWRLFQQRRALRNNPKAIWHRGVAITVLFVLGISNIYAMAVARFPNGTLGWRGILFLILIFVSFSLGRAVLIDFIVNIFGDVQIYTTRDENDSRFYRLRDKILQVTVDAIVRAISPRLNGGHVYDRVIVLAHSLGATIAMDAVVRISQLALQGALTTEEFNRIRAFVTLGSSLEKTRYFFEVSGASPSLSYEQWRNDVFGTIFTCDPAVLEQDGGRGIFWVNYWYFQDAICNEIHSFKSYLQPGESIESARTLRLQREGNPEWEDGAGGRPICRNEKGNKHITLTHPVLHSDYLDDEWFWHSSLGPGKTLIHLGALEVITNRLTGDSKWRWPTLSKQS